MIEHERKFEEYKIPSINSVSRGIEAQSIESKFHYESYPSASTRKKKGIFPNMSRSPLPSTSLHSPNHQQSKNEVSRQPSLNSSNKSTDFSFCRQCRNISNERNHRLRNPQESSTTQYDLSSSNKEISPDHNLAQVENFSLRLENGSKQSQSRYGDLVPCDRNSTDVLKYGRSHPPINKSSLRNIPLPSYQLDFLKSFSSINYFLMSGSTVASKFYKSFLSHVFRVNSFSSSTFLSVILYFLVSITVLASPSGASSFPPSKFSPDSYGLWDRSLTLDEQGHFRVEWTATATDIQFRLTAKTRGYIGFGLSSQAKMHGADIVVG